MASARYFIVGIDFGNSNSMFVINEFRNKRSNVYCYSPVSDQATSQKHSSDLLYQSNKRYRKLPLAFSTTQFYQETNFVNNDKTFQFIIHDFKRELYKQTNGLFDRSNILKKDIFCQLPTGQQQYVLQNAFAITYGLIVRSIFVVLRRDFDYSNESITFVCTIPEIATQDQAIFTIQSFISGCELARKQFPEIVTQEISEECVYTISEPIASFFQIKLEYMLDFQGEQNVIILDFGGCTIDVSVFKVAENKLPVLLHGDAIPGGGSYVNQLMEQILSGQCGIRQDISEFMRRFEESKFDIYGDQEDLIYDLSAFDFNIEHAQEAFGDGEEVYVGDDKQLIILQSYFLRKVEEYIEGVLEIISQINTRFGHSSYIFLTGGFMNCPWLKLQVCQKCNSAGTQVFTAAQPSTSICCGSSRIFECGLVKTFARDVVFRLNGKSTLIMTAGAKISELTVKEENFLLPDNDGLLCLEFEEDAKKKQLLLEKQRFARQISLKLVMLPQSKNTIIYYKWRFPPETEEFIQNVHPQYQQRYHVLPLSELIIERDISQAEQQLAMQLRHEISPSAEQDDYLTLTKEGLELATAFLVAKLQHLFFMGDDVDFMRYNSNLQVHIPFFPKALFRDPLSYEKFCVLNGINLDIFQQMFHVFRLVFGDFWSLGANIFKKIAARNVLEFTFRFGAEVACSGISVADTPQLLRLSSPAECLIDEHSQLICFNNQTMLFSPAAQGTIALVKLSRAFASPLVQFLIHVVLQHYFRHYDFGVIAINEAIQLRITSDREIDLEQLDEIQACFNAVSQIAGLVGKSIITLNMAKYHACSDATADCCFELFSKGANILGFRAWKPEEREIFYQLTYNNLIRLTEMYNDMVKNDACVGISLVCDFKDFDENFSKATCLFPTSGTCLASHLVIFSEKPHDPYFEQKLPITRGKIQATFARTQCEGVLSDDISKRNTMDTCQEGEFFRDAVCYIDQHDRQRIYRICARCTGTDVARKLREATLPQIVQLSTEGAHTEGIYTNYPVCQAGQLFDACAGWRPLYLKIALEHLYVSQRFLHCAQDHCAGVPVIAAPNNFTAKCPHCGRMYCNLCEYWHTNAKEQCVFQGSVRRCAHCKLIYDKVQGCNHIACPCGAHNCFVCQQSFDTAKQCYAHLDAQHGGCF